MNKFSMILVLVLMIWNLMILVEVDLTLEMLPILVEGMEVVLQLVVMEVVLQLVVVTLLLVVEMLLLVVVGMLLLVEVMVAMLLVEVTEVEVMMVNGNKIFGMMSMVMVMIMVMKKILNLMNF
jgi:hypothetical protein